MRGVRRSVEGLGRQGGGGGAKSETHLRLAPVLYTVCIATHPDPPPLVLIPYKQGLGCSQCGVHAVTRLLLAACLLPAPLLPCLVLLPPLASLAGCRLLAAGFFVLAAGATQCSCRLPSACGWSAAGCWSVRSSVGRRAYAHCLCHWKASPIARQSRPDIALINSCVTSSGTSSGSFLTSASKMECRCSTPCVAPEI